MDSTCKPSSFGIFKSQISRLTGSVSNIAIPRAPEEAVRMTGWLGSWPRTSRSEEHTSELQSLTNLVCRLLLEKKKKKTTSNRKHQTPSCRGKHRPGRWG